MHPIRHWMKLSCSHWSYTCGRTVTFPTTLKMLLSSPFSKKGTGRSVGTIVAVPCSPFQGKSLQGFSSFFKSSQKKSILNHNADFGHPEGQLTWSFVLEEARKEQRTIENPLLFTFYDLKKAFDTIPSLALWKALAHFGYPDHFVSQVKGLHDGMIETIFQSTVATVSPFITVGGVWPPTLFLCFMTCAEMTMQWSANPVSILNNCWTTSPTLTLGLAQKLTSKRQKSWYNPLQVKKLQTSISPF